MIALAPPPAPPPAPGNRRTAKRLANQMFVTATNEVAVTNIATDIMRSIFDRAGSTYCGDPDNTHRKTP